MVNKDSIGAKCLRTLSGLFSPNLMDQSSCKMGLALACAVRILHGDWSIRLGESRPDKVLKHLAAMLDKIEWRKSLCQESFEVNQ